MQRNQFAGHNVTNCVWFREKKSQGAISEPKESLLLMSQMMWLVENDGSHIIMTLTSSEQERVSLVSSKIYCGTITVRKQFDQKPTQLQEVNQTWCIILVFFFVSCSTDSRGGNYKKKSGSGWEIRFKIPGPTKKTVINVGSGPQSMMYKISVVLVLPFLLCWFLSNKFI